MSRIKCPVCGNNKNLNVLTGEGCCTEDEYAIVYQCSRFLCDACDPNLYGDITIVRIYDRHVFMWKGRILLRMDDL